jgi:hypothetical protein
MKALRKILASLAALSILLTLAAGFAWWSIHTAWFASLVRGRIVSALQKNTGGRTELGAFSFNPDTLHAKISRLVIHGTEPASAPPLLTVASIDVGLKILSILHRDVDVPGIWKSRKASSKQTTAKPPLPSKPKTPACSLTINPPTPATASPLIPASSVAASFRLRSGPFISFPKPASIRTALISKASISPPAKTHHPSNSPAE